MKTIINLKDLLSIVSIIVKKTPSNIPLSMHFLIHAEK